MPAGIFRRMRVLSLMRPTPRQSRHGSEMVCPDPWHSGHVCRIWKNPRELITWPTPPQVRHCLVPPPDFEPDPLHVLQATSRSNSSSLSTPLAASSSEISRP